MNTQEKTPYRALYLPINRIKDYQCLCHSASLRTPCEHPTNANMFILKWVPFDHDPEAKSILGRIGNLEGSTYIRKQITKKRKLVSLSRYATMNNVNIYDTVPDTQPISNAKA